MARKHAIQSLLNTYIERFGSIDLLLPDGIKVEMGITQDTKHGTTKQNDYCWVEVARDDRSALLDRYSMSMSFDDGKNRIVDNADKGIVYII